MTSDHPFSGILKCSRCGTSFKSHTRQKSGKKIVSYLCRKTLIKQCDCPMILEKVVEQEIIKYCNLLNLTDEPKTDAAQEKRNKENKKILKQLYKALEKINARKKKWQYGWANEMLSDEDYKQRMLEEQKRESEVQTQINELESKIDTPKPHDQKNMKFISETFSNWNELTTTEKKQFMQLFFESIVIDVERIGKRKPNRLIVKEINFN